MREAFEKWMTDDGKWPRAIEQRNGAYVLMQTAAAWEAWRMAWLECEIASAKNRPVSA
jgi:hypothetical protein